MTIENEVKLGKRCFQCILKEVPRLHGLGNENRSQPKKYQGDNGYEATLENK